MKQLPKHCQGQPMGIFDSVKASVAHFLKLPVDECLEYHKALRTTPHSLVTPVQVDFYSIYRIDVVVFLSFLGFINDFRSIIYYTTWKHR